MALPVGHPSAFRHFGHFQGFKAELFASLELRDHFSTAHFGKPELGVKPPGYNNITAKMIQASVNN